MTDMADLIAQLDQIPRDEDGPVFSAPWEASAFALAVRLSEEGRFTWPEWVAFLADEIQRAQLEGDPELGNTYYHHWVAALESICAAKLLIGFDEMDLRKGIWRKAYLNTPHGKPIELSAAFNDREAGS